MAAQLTAHRINNGLRNKGENLYNAQSGAIPGPEPTERPYLEADPSRQQTLSPSVLSPGVSSIRAEKPNKRKQDATNSLSLVQARAHYPDSSGANVTVASSLLHLAASRFHFPGARIFHGGMCSEGNLKIIQRKVEFYGEHKRQVMSYLCERAPAKRCKIITVTQATPVLPLKFLCASAVNKMQFFY